MDKICAPTPRPKFKRMNLLEQKQRYTIEILQNDNYSQTDIVKIILEINKLWTHLVHDIIKKTNIKLSSVLLILWVYYKLIVVRLNKSNLSKTVSFLGGLPKFTSATKNVHKPEESSLKTDWYCFIPLNLIWEMVGKIQKHTTTQLETVIRP